MDAAADGPEHLLPRILVVTNDFPPRVGGTQRYVHDLVRHLPPDQVTVLAPPWEGWEAFDQAQPFPVLRHRRMLAPTPELRRRVLSLVDETGAEIVLFGHGYPLGELGPGVKAATGVPYAMLTHGLEFMLAAMPVVRSRMRRAFSEARVVFTVSRFMQHKLRRAIPWQVPRMPLPPGVDLERFHPGVSGLEVRARHGLSDRLVVACISRLVPRKGQDVLLRAWPRVLRHVPDAALMLVGDGPHRGALARLRSRVDGTVVFAGEVPEEELPAYYAACDVFAMPCRDERFGFEVEGLGIVYLEAAASARPVIAGRSGGAPEAVLDGETGFVVDGADVADVTEALVALLRDPSEARRLGKAGRARAEREWGWDVVIRRFASAIAPR
ncbi:MAG TPA: glycosyltransferase family 4 protein [Actinomycetota bacterium]